MLARIALGLLLAGAGCRRAAPTCDPARAAIVEVRDRAGGIELVLRPSTTGSTAQLCDARGGSLGGLVEAPEWSLRDPSGAVRIRIATSDGGEDPILLRAAGRAPLRLYDERGLLRLLDPLGVPVAQIGREAGRAVAFDPAGVPIATAAALEGRRVLRGRDGAVLRYLLGLRSDIAAAAFALPGLDPAEQLLLARFLDRRG